MAAEGGELTGTLQEQMEEQRRRVREMEEGLAASQLGAPGRRREPPYIPMRGLGESTPVRDDTELKAGMETAAEESRRRRDARELPLYAEDVRRGTSSHNVSWRGDADAEAVRGRTSMRSGGSGGSRGQTTSGSRSPVRHSHHGRSETYSRPGAGAVWGDETGRERVNTVISAVDAYMSAKDARHESKYKVPPPRALVFEEGNDLRCFLSDFRDMADGAGMAPKHQLSYLKQAVPITAKDTMTRHHVKSVDDAVEVLRELYEPKRDAWTLLSAVGEINQLPNERFLALTGRIEDAVRRYAEKVHMEPEDFDAIVKDRFKHAIADSETRNQFLWDKTDMSVDDMAKKAQQFQDRKKESAEPTRKRVLRTEGQGPDNERLKAEVAELKRQIAELMLTRKAEPRAQNTDGRKTNFECWNCGKTGHYSRSCKAKKQGDGFSRRPSRARRGKSGRSAKQGQEELSDALNEEVQEQ